MHAAGKNSGTVLFTESARARDEGAGMSLVNDALRDLDARRHMDAVGAGGTAIVEHHPQWRSYRFRGNFAAATLAFVAVVVLMQYGVLDVSWPPSEEVPELPRTPSAGTHKPVRPEGRVVVSLAPNRPASDVAGPPQRLDAAGPTGSQVSATRPVFPAGQDAVPSLTDAGAAVTVDPAPATAGANRRPVRVPATVMSRAQVADLIEKGEAALVENRLSRPRGNSAYDYFTAARERDPDDAAVARGFERLHDQYRRIVVESIERRDLDRAESILARWTRLGGEPQSRLLASLDALRRDMRSMSPIAGSVSPSTSAVTRRQSVESEDPPLMAGATVVTATSPGRPQRSDIDKSDRQYAAERLANARRLAKRNDLPGAILLLESNEGGALWGDEVAVAYLCELYVQAGDLAKAEALLSELGNRGISAVYPNALLKKARFGAEAALNYLERVEAKDENSLALLAGLYHRAERFKGAQRTYRKLAEVAPGSGVYWLGLAVSSDSLGQPDLALRAYGHALELGGHQPDTEAFIRSRLGRLGAGT
jgi:tetratricopeptide (TPR) repeat protein